METTEQFCNGCKGQNSCTGTRLIHAGEVSGWLSAGTSIFRGSVSLHTGLGQKEKSSCPVSELPRGLWFPAGEDGQLICFGSLLMLLVVLVKDPLLK